MYIICPATITVPVMRGNVLCADKGEMFGWGNTEYNQLSNGEQSSEMQVSIPRRVLLNNVGKIVKVAAAGSSCAVINGKSQHSTISLHILHIYLLTNYLFFFNNLYKSLYFKLYVWHCHYSVQIQNNDMAKAGVFVYNSCERHAAKCHATQGCLYNY